MAKRRGKQSIWPPIGAPSFEKPTGMFRSPQKMDPDSKPDTLLGYALGPASAERKHGGAQSAPSLRHQACKGLRNNPGK